MEDVMKTNEAKRYFWLLCAGVPLIIGTTVSIVLVVCGETVGWWNVLYVLFWIAIALVLITTIICIGYFWYCCSIMLVRCIMSRRARGVHHLELRELKYAGEEAVVVSLAVGVAAGAESRAEGHVADSNITGD